MNFSDKDIRGQMRLGGDSHWEFKEIEFVSNVPRSPRRDDIADKLAAFSDTDSSVVWHTGIMYKRGHVNRWTQAGLCR